MFSIRNLEKFIGDTPALADKKEEIMAQARELTGEGNNVLSGSAAQILLGIEWAAPFFRAIETDLDHLQMALEDQKAADRKS